MKKFIFTKIFVLLIISPSLIKSQVGDRVVAIVDKEIITESDLRYSIQIIATQNRLDPKTPGLAEKVLDGLINEKLFLAQSYEDSIEVSDDEVADRLDRQLKMLVQQYGSEKEIEEIYGMSISKMKREYQDEIKKQLLVQKIKQTRGASLIISVKEVEEFYNFYKDSLPIVPTEYQLSHIFIKPKPSPERDMSTLKKAFNLIDSLNGGVSFDDLAKRHSTDGGSASQGGDLGSVRRGTFVKEFEEAVYTLKVGQISKPIKTQFGYHIIKLLERKGELVKPQHILLSIDASVGDDDSAITKLNDLKKRAVSGESFAVLAKQFSEDSDTKDIGGDLGQLTIEQMEESLQETIKSLKQGDISEPRKITVGSGYGYHVVLVRSIILEHTINLKDDYRKIENLALQIKSQKKQQEWIEEMRKNIYWEKKL
ncbi:MAG: peptidylprolyl isomerase [Bacteroidetes bacterium]|nr:peptidylprolyl isomerase [Bacteroidota bacterium]